MSLEDRLRKLNRVSRPRASRAAEKGRSGCADLHPISVRESKRRGVTVRETRFSYETVHGKQLLGDVRKVDPALLGLAAGEAGGIDPDRALFLDTETTGLGSGASSYVFMVGFLRLEDDAVRVDQILLDGPEVEAAFLDRVRSKLRGRRSLVSFFGKSFDRHRLDDRFAMHRGGRPLVEMPHLDLYHVARRLFGSRLPDGRLRTFEEKVLGVKRVDDLPGAECPDAYFDYLEGIDDTPLERVFTHNLIDVLSLLSLTIQVGTALREPRGGVEAAAAGLVLLAAGDDERAQHHLERSQRSLRAGAYVVDPNLKRAGLALARQHRIDAPESSLKVLDRLINALPDDPEPCHEAAKIAEHQLRDFERAREYALELRARARMRRGGRSPFLEDAMKRLERLRERLKGRGG